MSLLFNMLSRLVIAFLPRSKHLLISWLQSPSAHAPPQLENPLKVTLEKANVLEQKPSTAKIKKKRKVMGAHGD